MTGTRGQGRSARTRSGHLAILITVLSVGCDGQALPGGNPEDPSAGGQTGDPSAGGPRFTSVVLDGSEVEGGNTDAPPGDCPAVIGTRMGTAPFLTWPALGDGTLRVVPEAPDPADPDTSGWWVADFGLGLRQLRLAEGGGLESGPSLRLPSPPMALMPHGREQLVVLMFDGLLRVSLGGPRPTVVANVTLPASPRGAQVVNVDGRPVVHVVVDIVRPPRQRSDGLGTCAARETARVVRFAMTDDGLEALPSIDLGADATSAWFAGDGMYVAYDYRDSTETSRWPGGTALQWFSLLDEERRSDRVILPGALSDPGHLHLEGGKARAVVLRASTEGLEPSVLQSLATLVQLDIQDPEQLAVDASCEFPLVWERVGDFSKGLDLHREQVLFLPGAIAVRDADVKPEPRPGARTGRLVRLADGDACTLHALTLPVDASLAQGPGNTLLAWGAAAGEPAEFDDRAEWEKAAAGDLEVALLSSQGELLAELSLPADGERGFWPTHGALVSAAQPAGADAPQSEQAVPDTLLVATTEAAGTQSPSITRVLVTESSLMRAEPLPGAFAFAEPRAGQGSRVLTAGAASARVFDLSSREPAKPVASAELLPVTAHAWLLDGGLASAPRGRGDADLQVDVLPDTALPRTIRGSHVLPADTILYRAGNHLVALASDGHCQLEPDQTMRVLGMDGNALSEIGALPVQDLVGSTPRCSESHTGVNANSPLPHSLLLGFVFGATGRGIDSASDLTVVGLHDASAPELHRLPLAAGQRGVNAVFTESGLLHTYAVETGEQVSMRPRVGYFVREIDLSKPGAPRISEGVNVPGVAIAGQGPAWYLHDQQWAGVGTPPEMFVRRVVRQQGELRVTASTALPDAASSAGFVDGNTLLAVTLPAPPFCYACQAGELVLLSSDDLQMHGTLPLPGSDPTIRGSHGSLLVVQGQWDYEGNPIPRLLVIDTVDPDAPTVVADLPGELTDLRDGRLLYVAGRHTGDWIEAGLQDGALIALDLNALTSKGSSSIASNAFAR